MEHVCFDSRVGRLCVHAEDGMLRRIEWADRPGGGETELLNEARRQLEGYFEGQRQVFDLPLAVEGTAFQKRVFAAMRRISYGATRSYGELAHELDTSPRAVGMACGANPLPIVIPCHRVVAAVGLGGFSGAGGLPAKQALLRLEGALPAVFDL